MTINYYGEHANQTQNKGSRSKWSYNSSARQRSGYKNKVKNGYILKPWVEDIVRIIVAEIVDRDNLDEQMYDTRNMYTS